MVQYTVHPLTKLSQRVRHGIAGFWDSWRGPRCQEMICVFQFHTLREIRVEVIRCSGSLFGCTVALLVVDAPSPRADHAFSGRIAKRRTAKRCWFLQRVLECGIRVRGSLDVPRL